MPTIKEIENEIKNNIAATQRAGVNFIIEISRLESYIINGKDERGQKLSNQQLSEIKQLLRNMKKLEELKKPPAKFAYNYSSIYGTFTTKAETEPQAYQMFQAWLKQKEIETQPEPVPIETPLVTEPEPVIIEQPIITAAPITTPTVDDSISTGMVTQQVINFNIVNGRAVGSIKFVATNSFNSYYYNKDIINMVQFKTPNGVTLLVKQNRLRFTQTERDEIIHYDESVQENTRVTVESFVWEWMDKPAGAFSNKYIIDISEAEPPKPTQAGFMGAGVAGAIAGLILLGFVADHKRTK